MFDFGYKTLPQDDSQYFKGIDTHGAHVPVGDVAAYRAYPNHRWVYNKITLCETQHLYAFPDGDDDPSFPIFRKPIYNLYGMSAGAGPILTKAQYDKDYKPGHFIMPLLEGVQYSTDFVIVNGEPVWARTMLCQLNNVGSFKSFELAVPSTNIINTMIDWISKHLKNFTGVVNLETIGLSIIECHLRMSPQFIDLYGVGWLNAVAELYAGNNWDRPEHEFDEGYSIPLRVQDPGRYRFTKESIRKAKLECSSVQIHIKEKGENITKEKDAQDKHSFRLAVVNGLQRAHCERALDILTDGLEKS